MRLSILPLLILLAMPVHAADSIEFRSVDIFLDSNEPVAAWQFRLSDKNSMMKIVGVENGESEVFPDAPYYDRDAVAEGSADRIIVADYSLADEHQLPTGRVRIATLHIMLSGPGKPEFDLQLVTATTWNGDVIDAVISVDSDTGSTP